MQRYCSGPGRKYSHNAGAKRQAKGLGPPSATSLGGTRANTLRTARLGGAAPKSLKAMPYGNAKIWMRLSVAAPGQIPDFMPDATPILCLPPAE